MVVQDSINDIVKRLTNKEIDFGQAYDLIKQLPKPWHRPEWHQRRAELIKDSCEKCGNQTGPMVIQHTAHPSAFRLLKAEILAQFKEQYPEFYAVTARVREDAYYQSLSKVVMLSQFTGYEAYVHSILDQLDVDVEATVQAAGIVRECCPACKRLVTDSHYRKTWSKYKCEAGHVFEHTASVIWYKKYRTKDKKEAERAAKLAILRRDKSEIDTKLYHYEQQKDGQIGKEALLRAVAEHEVYMSMQHTMTYCKSCAYQEDLEKGRIK